MINARIVICAMLVSWFTGCTVMDKSMSAPAKFTLDYDTPVNLPLQQQLQTLDGRLRARHGMTTQHTAVGVIDLNKSHLAMLHPDRIEYAASVAKIGILLAWFDHYPATARNLDPETRHELGLMIKASSNEMAAKFSRQLGLRTVQDVLNRHGFYDPDHGGGIWVGKHYGRSDERIGDPVANHSHAATIRQLLRFYLLLDQEKLVSVEASKTMKGIFASPDIPHDDIKFVKALKGRPVCILRKWGSWETWLHDAAIITGPGRRYILVALTNHPKGDDYLVELARAVDDLMSGAAGRE